MYAVPGDRIENGQQKKSRDLFCHHYRLFHVTAMAMVYSFLFVCRLHDVICGRARILNGSRVFDSTARSIIAEHEKTTSCLDSRLLLFDSPDEKKMMII